jgi:hypothetical protein
MPSSTADQDRILVQVDRRLAAAVAAVCALVLIAKLWLVTRVNINWDEFFFLSEIHALLRGDLHSSFQTAYTRLFGWLTLLGEHEVARINIARFGMLALLALTAWLLFRLARRWYSAPAAALGVLAFLGLWATLRHGASFRVDALLLPLQVGALLALTQPAWSLARRSVVSGALLGIACVLSLKAVLLAPVVVALQLLPSGVAGEPPHGRPARLRGALQLALVATIVAGTLLAAHQIALPDTASTATPAGLQPQSVAQRATDAWQRTVSEAEFLPREPVLREQLRADPLFWLLAAAGLAVALVRRHWGGAACALALAPVLFYRNAFAYYFVVMLAPLAVLVAASTDTAITSIRRHATERTAHWAVAGLALALALQAGSHALRLTADRQVEQRRLVEGVHAMFREPVPYLDHSGMISSFPKANLFMTSWGMERYAEDGRGFVRDALLQRRAPLLIENRAELRVGAPRYGLLLAEDRALIERFYLPYWGPVRVAGVQQPVAAGVAQRVELPFPGDWRLRSSQGVTVDGRRLAPGDVFSVGEARAAAGAAAGFPSVEVVLPADQPAQRAAFTAIWAGAGPPPPEPAPHPILYDRL